MKSIKPQILAAISGAIAAYIADEEACQAAAAGTGRGPGPAPEPLGNVRASGGHAAQALDAAAEFEVAVSYQRSGGQLVRYRLIPPDPPLAKGGMSRAGTARQFR